MTKISKKILLNSSNLFNQIDEDIFLDIELYNNICEIKPERFDNDFDLQKEFEKERNNSRNFILYGTIDSIVDSDSPQKQIIIDNSINITSLTNQISTLNNTISSNNNLIKNLNDRIIIINGQIENEENILELLPPKSISRNFHENTIKTLNSDLVSINSQIATYTSSNNDYTLQISSKQNDINSLLLSNIETQNSIDSNIEFLELWKQTAKPSSIIEKPQIQNYIPKDTIILNDDSILKYVQNIDTSLLNYEYKNAFDVIRKKYYIELNDYSNTDQETLYLFVNGETLNDVSSNFFVKNQLFKQTIVFRDPDGDIIPYGTDDEFINNDGTSFSVNNDFPFFYNKHWIKQNIIIERAYTSNVSFETENVTINEGETIVVNLKLDKPTLEDCTVILQYLNLTTSVDDYEILQETVIFNAGTDTATLSIKASSDSNVEVSEKFKIVMSNFLNCAQGAISEFEVTIMKTNISNFALYNISSIYKNLLSFGEQNPTNSVLYSNLRDGYFIGDKDSKSFFPNDNYIIKIKNNGIDTIFPSNDEFNNNDFIFRSGDTLSFQIENSYSGISKQTAGVKINVNPFSQFSAIVNINGIIYANIKTNLNLINALNLDINVKTYTFSLKQVLDADDNVIEEYVLLESNKIGLPIFVKNLESNLVDEEFILIDPTDTRFINYTPYPSIPETIKLLSNTSNGNFCNYEFSIQKEGYKNINISSEQLAASSDGSNYYLITGYRDINSAYKDGDCFNAGDLSSTVNLITSYVNGALLNYSSNNLTDNVYAKFSQASLSVLPCTTQNQIGGFNIVT